MYQVYNATSTDLSDRTKFHDSFTLQRFDDLKCPIYQLWMNPILDARSVIESWLRRYYLEYMAILRWEDKPMVRWLFALGTDIKKNATMPDPIFGAWITVALAALATSAQLGGSDDHREEILKCVELPYAYLLFEILREAEGCRKGKTANNASRILPTLSPTPRGRIKSNRSRENGRTN